MSNKPLSTAILPKISPRKDLLGSFLEYMAIAKKIGSALKILKEGKLDLFFYKTLKKLGFKKILPPLPFWLMIEPINVCNLRCPICPTGSGKMTRPPRSMKLAEFKKIIDEVRGYASKILLYNLGEPLLNQEALAMIRYAVDSGIRVKISTNGTLIKSKEIARAIVKSGLYYLTFSFDGLDQATYAKYRVGANIDDVIAGIGFVAEARRALGSSTPKIELQLVLTKNNEHQKGEFEQFAKKIGADFYLIKSLHLFGETEFQGLAKDYLPKDLAMSRYAFDRDGKLILRGENKNRCAYVEESVTVASDGSVIPCCYDYNSQYVMGNVFNERLKDIWKNKKYQLFRDQIKKDREKIIMCASCQEGRELFMGEKKSTT